MPPLHENGFLGAQIKEWSCRHRAGNAQLFATADAVNQDCYKLVSSIRVNNRDVRQVLTATLFARCMEHFQAVVVLVERGMRSPARVALRSLLEALFALGGITNDTETLRRYVQNHELSRLRTWKAARRDGSFAEVRAAATDELGKEIAETIAEQGIARLTMKSLAEKAGLVDYYLTIYSSLSATAHAEVQDLQRYFRADASGEIRGMSFGPTARETPLLLASAGNCMIMALGEAAKVFGQDYTASCHAHADAFEGCLAAAGVDEDPGPPK